jgi:hypothetical protein
MSYYNFLAKENQMEVCPLSGLDNQYPGDYSRAFACSILPYLYGIVFASRKTYPLQREPYRFTTFRSNNKMG